MNGMRPFEPATMRLCVSASLLAFALASTALSGQVSRALNPAANLRPGRKARVRRLGRRQLPSDRVPRVSGSTTGTSSDSRTGTSSTPERPSPSGAAVVTAPAPRPLQSGGPTERWRHNLPRRARRAHAAAAHRLAPLRQQRHRLRRHRRFLVSVALSCRAQACQRTRSCVRASAQRSSRRCCRGLVAARVGRRAISFRIRMPRQPRDVRRLQARTDRRQGKGQRAKVRYHVPGHRPKA